MAACKAFRHWGSAAVLFKPQIPRWRETPATTHLRKNKLKSREGVKRQQRRICLGVFSDSFCIPSLQGSAPLLGACQE
jgi:hypothetical protein